MRLKVFIDGRHGTTGLKIDERLSRHPNIELLSIDELERKNLKLRAAYLNEADIVFLCLPDQAAIEALQLIRPDNTRTRILDTSTAHRIDSQWVYGLPELDAQQRQAIQNAQRVSVPGCHATAFVLALHPLIKAGILNKESQISAFSVTGYSGGGKNMIAQYQQNQTLPTEMLSPRLYSLALQHKHLPEMQLKSGLVYSPLFMPVVANFERGLMVSIPIFQSQMRQKYRAQDIYYFLNEYYAGEQFVKIQPPMDYSKVENNYLAATGCNYTNCAKIFVLGDADRIMLVSMLDNLGKGASGAAIQCMNTMIGSEEGAGLDKLT